MRCPRTFLPSAPLVVRPYENQALKIFPVQYLVPRHLGILWATDMFSLTAILPHPKSSAAERGLCVPLSVPFRAATQHPWSFDNKMSSSVQTHSTNSSRGRSSS